MPQTDHQKKATSEVAKWLAMNERNHAWLAQAAGIDPGTVGDFLNEQRWPKLTTLGKIDSALGWPVGTIRQIAAGAKVEISRTADDVPADQPPAADDPRLSEASLDQLLDEISERRIGRLSRGQQLRRTQDQAGEPPVDDPDDMEPR